MKREFLLKQIISGALQISDINGEDDDDESGESDEEDKEDWEANSDQEF